MDPGGYLSDGSENFEGKKYNNSNTFLYQILKCYLIFYLKQCLSKTNEFILRYACLGIATLLIPGVIRDDPGNFACKKNISNSKKSFISLI